MTLRGKIVRTSRRHDFSMLPPRTILDAQDTAVIGVGQISDIFAGKAIGLSHPTASKCEGIERIATR